MKRRWLWNKQRKAKTRLTGYFEEGRNHWCDCTHGTPRRSLSWPPSGCTRCHYPCRRRTRPPRRSTPYPDRRESFGRHLRCKCPGYSCSRWCRRRPSAAARPPRSSRSGSKVHTDFPRLADLSIDTKRSKYAGTYLHSPVTRCIDVPLTSFSYPRAVCTRSIGELCRLLGRPSYRSCCTGRRGTTARLRRKAGIWGKVLITNGGRACAKGNLISRFARDNVGKWLRSFWREIKDRKNV